MPITYAELNGPLSVKLDDQFSDRYRPTVRVEAFNTAIRKATAALGWAMANRKGPEEALRELTMLRVFQTNSQGGVSLGDPTLGHSIWNVLGVYARPLTVQPATILPLDPAVSQYRDDLAFSGTGDPVERVTVEEVPMIRTNFLRNGNEILAGNTNRVTFSYYIIGEASSTGFITGGQELRVLPQSATSQQLIAISYLKKPQEFTGPSGTTDFPQSFIQTLVEWAANTIVGPQDGSPPMYQATEKDAAQLFGFIA